MPQEEVTARDSDRENAAAAEAAAQVREDLRVAPDIDPLDALLAIDIRPEDVADEADVRIVGGQVVKWKYRALSGPEIDSLDERCTNWVRRGRGERVKERDTQLFTRLIVSTATRSPNLEDQRLKEKFGAGDPQVLVGRVLMPGTIDGLSTKILELSGYTDDLIGTAGN